jgi:hypothetical protein
MSGGNMEKYSYAGEYPIDSGELPPGRFLTPRQVAMIDEALCSLGEYGELRLVIEKGRLRFLITNKSFDALKWTPGSLSRGSG